MPPAPPAPAAERRRAVAVVALVFMALLAIMLERVVPQPGGRVLVPDAREPTAMAPLPGGGLLFGERATGRVRLVEADGDLRARPLVDLDVSSDGARGLLGLAVDGSEDVYATWTRPDRRLVVGRVQPRPTKVLWVGPLSAPGANGGHLAMAPDGGLVVGIGDLGAPEVTDDADAPNGKLLRLNPRGPAPQAAEVLSSGWHNPLAFTFRGDGSLWVADNSPGERPERLAPVEPGGRPGRVIQLAANIAPSGVAPLPNDRLAVCGFLSGDLRAFDTTATALGIQSGEDLATDCSLGVVRLAGGDLAYADELTIRVLDLLPAGA